MQALPAGTILPSPSRKRRWRSGLLQRAIPITPIPTTAYPTPATRPAFSLLDCSKTREFLQDGYTHWRTNLRTMLKEEAALG